jgi:hypothetical protein
MLDGIITGHRSMSLGAWARKHRIDNGFSKALRGSLDEPDETPYLVDSIMKGFRKLSKPGKNEVRNSLIRVQIYCSIHGNFDPIKLSKQLFISQTLERLLFGSNLLHREGPEEEEETKPRK